MSGPIDITGEVIGLFDQEEVLAFFEIAGSGLSGLGKVSRPKDAKGVNYLSIGFVIDTPAGTRSPAPELVGRFTEATLKAQLPETRGVMPPASVRTHAELDIAGMDILFSRDIVPDRVFVESRLLPAIRKIGGIQTGELIWWPDVDESADESLLNRLLKLLKGR